MREVVEVAPRLQPYEPYDLWLLGVSVAGTYGSSKETKLLARAWQHMMWRCYDPNHKRYVAYGAKGVSVCKRWHNVLCYIEDVKSIQGWGAKLLDWDGYALDKDYYSSNQYSPETCVWLPNSENALYTTRTQVIKVTTGEGVPQVYLTRAEAGDALALPQRTIRRFIDAGVLTKLALQNSHYTGWLFETYHPPVPLRHSLIGDS